jgi:hypothetical protein
MLSETEKAKVKVKAAKVKAKEKAAKVKAKEKAVTVKEKEKEKAVKAKEKAVKVKAKYKAKKVIEDLVHPNIVGGDNILRHLNIFRILKYNKKLRELNEKKAELQNKKDELKKINEYLDELSKTESNNVELKTAELYTLAKRYKINDIENNTRYGERLQDLVSYYRILDNSPNPRLGTIG